MLVRFNLWQRLLNLKVFLCDATILLVEICCTIVIGIIIFNATAKLNHTFHLRCRSLGQLAFRHLIEIDYRSNFSAFRATTISFTISLICKTLTVLAYFNIWLADLCDAILFRSWELEVCCNQSFTKRLCLVQVDITWYSFWIHYFLFLNGSISEGGLFS